jgi:Cu(I)/Ag(I) efflux system membrane fusion protein
MNKVGGKVMTGHEGHLGTKDTPTTNNKNQSSMNERMNVSTVFQNQLKDAFNDYIKLKDALVKDASNNVVTESKRLIANLSKIEMKLLTNKEAHNHWMSIEKEIKASAVSISNTSKIKEQRKYFINLSLYFTNAIKVFGINEKVYSQFCPMADSNKGAYWLSKEKQVLNPYYGDSMLTCGSVKQVIE